MQAIDIQALEKHYPAGFWRKRWKAALKGISFQVEEGEIFGFLGPNGAGKTTTLKILMGLMEPTRGRAFLFGTDHRDPRVRARIGFLPEQPYFYDYLTARELLDYYGQLSGVGARERQTRVPQMLELVGLADCGNLQLRKFSKGMLQRVGIAQAILHDPALVFLDEPTSGLDPVGRRDVREIIRRLKDQGKTVFFSTHILADAEALCDRVGVLHLGELRGVGSVAELTARNRGQVEILWEKAPDALAPLTPNHRVAGEISTAVLDQEQLQAAIDLLRQSGAKLVSVTPVQSTLEEYFIERLADPEKVQVRGEDEGNASRSRVEGAP